MMEMPVFVLVFAITATAYFYILQKRRRASNRNPKDLPLPPGPKGWPFIGILFSVPPRDAWVTYGEWTKTYGDMIYFEVLGKKYLVLNSLKRTDDLLERRSSNYSDRVKMPMLIDLMRWDYNMAMLPYGSWWRRHRRGFNEYFHQNAVAKYLPIQAREARAFLYRLLTSPDEFMYHICHTFSAAIMDIAYGIPVKESGDPYISRAEVALDGLAKAGIPGSHMVDFFPILKYIPSWFPGAEFKRKARFWREVNQAVSDIPFERVEEELKAGIAPPSISASLIERLPSKGDNLREDERTIAKDVVALAYIGGADTTVSSVQSFFLAMALNPHIMKRAQDELDRVIGTNRLPDFNDRKDLPYINAVVNETMRWNLVLPLGVPHAASADDEYDGHYIPKGTVVIGNSWFILHDPEVFTDPSKYNPERYLKNGQLDTNVRDPNCAAFGFGRRICPGRHLSSNSLYSLISSVLAVYDIEPPVDENGKSMKLKAEFTSGMLTYPIPFNCTIRPRSPAAEALIRECGELIDQ